MKRPGTHTRRKHTVLQNRQPILLIIIFSIGKTIYRGKTGFKSRELQLHTSKGWCSRLDKKKNHENEQHVEGAENLQDMEKLSVWTKTSVTLSALRGQDWIWVIITWDYDEAWRKHNIAYACKLYNAIVLSFHQLHGEFYFIELRIRFFVNIWYLLDDDAAKLFKRRTACLELQQQIGKWGRALIFFNPWTTTLLPTPLGLHWQRHVWVM